MIVSPFSCDLGDILCNFDQQPSEEKATTTISPTIKTVSKTVSDLSDRFSVCNLLNSESEQHQQPRLSETSK